VSVAQTAPVNTQHRQDRKLPTARALAQRAAFDELDRVDAQITATPANSLGGIRCKAGICHELACSDADLAWPMLSSLMRDLAHVPLDDVTLLRSIFAKLAVPVPPRWTQDVAGEEDI